MSILVDRNTKVITQGMTGETGHLPHPAGARLGLMRMVALLAPALLTACSSAGSDLPEQDPAAVTAAFGTVLDGCAAGLTADGAIDEAALSAAGWNAIERNRGTGYQSSNWQRDGVKGRIELVRYGAELADNCSLD